MATETNPVNSEEQERQAEETKLQQAMFLRYQPRQGRADKLAANIPGHKGEND